jgi:hypothetical protein
MSPLDFLAWLRVELRDAGIHFAITSGQACVYYGIQQTTKDSDWIIALDDVHVQALADTAEIMAATSAELQEIAPPMDVLLP